MVYLALGFSILLFLEIVALYVIWFSGEGASETFSISLQYMAASVIFLASATSSRLALHLGYLDIHAVSILESYFYVLVFLNLAVPAYLWRELKGGSRKTTLGKGIKEFYGEKG